MSLLLSFVNQNFTPEIKLALVTNDFEIMWVGGSVAEISNGITGIALSNNRIYCAFQNDGIGVLDNAFNIIQHYKSERIRDPHSLTIHEGELYVVSTGNNSIIKLNLDENGLISEEVEFWKYPGVPTDFDSVHINSLCITNKGFYIAAFGKRDKGQGWSEINKGRIIDIRKGKTILDDINQPHSLFSNGNGSLLFCESKTGSLKNSNGKVLGSYYGYLRGLNKYKGQYIVASNARRHLFKSEATNLEGRILDFEDNNIFQSRLLFLNTKDFSVERELSLSALGNEVYDILPLHDSNIIISNKNMVPVSAINKSVFLENKLVNVIKNSEKNLENIKNSLSNEKSISLTDSNDIQNTSSVKLGPDLNPNSNNSYVEKKDYEKLLNEYEVLNSELHKLKAELDRERKNKQANIKQINFQTLAISKLTKKNHNFSDQLNANNQLSQDLKEQVVKLKNQLKADQLEISKIPSLKKELERHKAESEKYNTSIALRDEKIGKLKILASSLETEISGHKESNAKSIRDIENLNISLNKLQIQNERNENLVNDYKEKLNYELDKIRDKDEYINDLKSTIDFLNTEVEKVNQVKLKIDAELINKNEVISHLEQSKSEIIKVLHSIQGSYDRLSEENKSLAIKIERLENHKLQMDENLSSSHNLIGNLKKSILSYKKSISTLNRDHEIQLNGLKSLIIEKETEIEQNRSTTEQLRKKLKEQNTLLKQQGNKLHKTRKALKSTLLENKSIQKSYERQIIKIDTLTQNRKLNKQTISRLEKEANLHLETIDTLIKKINKQNSTIENLHKSIRRERDEFKSNADLLKKSVSFEMDKLYKENLEKLKTLYTEIKAIHQHNKTLQSKLNNELKRNDGLEKRYEKLNNKHDFIRKAILQLDKSLIKANKNNDKLQEILKKERIQNLEVIESLGYEINNLKKNYESKIDSMNVIIAEKNEKLNRKIERLKIQSKKAGDMYKLYISTLDKLTKSNYRIKELSKDVQEIDQYVDHLKSSYSWRIGSKITKSIDILIGWTGMLPNTNNKKDVIQ